MKIILASQSPRRKELLHLIVENFEIVPADIDEQPRNQENPQDYVRRMAREKAAAIAEQYPTDIIIASDTIVVNQGQILGKPTSRLDAKQMLQALSGKRHTVYTAVTIKASEKQTEVLKTAEVTFFELEDTEINRYLATEEYADKAGAYGIQGAAAVFVKEISGDYYSIVGFPIGEVNQLLKEFRN